MLENIGPNNQANKLENSFTEEQSFKIEEVFKNNPEIAVLFQNNKELFQKYVHSIFPNSKFKEIAFHGSNASFKNEGFKPMKPNFDTLNSIEGVYNFSTNLHFVKRYGENLYFVVLDVKNPIEENTSGEFVDDMDAPLSEALFKMGKQTGNAFAPKYEESLKDADAVINNIRGEDYVEKHPISGKEMGVPKQQVISVFKPEQIHILGSKKDIEQAEAWLKML